MAPPASKVRRKVSSSPLALYKAGLAAIKSWTPATSAAADAAALTALASCTQQLQARLPAAGPPAGGADACATTAAGHNNGDSAGDALAGAWALLDAVLPRMPSYGPCVDHNVDLALDDWEDEPGYLLACAHLELGKLLGRMWPRRVGSELAHLQAALRLFPAFVEGRIALGQALTSRADSEADLADAERLLRGALATATALAAGQDGDDGGDRGAAGAGAAAPSGHGGGAEGPGGDDEDEGSLPLLLQASAACLREWRARTAARRSLAMLLCQAGRDQEAAPHLTALGFTHRLARPVLHYPLEGTPPTMSAAGHERYAHAVDGALPAPLLTVLKAAFAPDSRFWAEHGYGRVGYFSYMHELGSPDLSAVHQAGTLLHRIGVARVPALAKARFVEWWVHCRRHPSGHQLHFDSDDEGQGGVRNPICSSVVYLTGGVGGPTLVTPQLLGGPLATEGWLVYPNYNRYCIFKGDVLHGVVPGRGPSPMPGEYRITLMFAFWEDILCRPRTDGLPGPSQPFPFATGPTHMDTDGAAAPASRYTWMQDMPAHPEGAGGWGASSPVDVTPTAIERVWGRVDGGAAPPGAICYDQCFQGF